MGMTVSCKLPLQSEQAIARVKIAVETAEISSQNIHRNQHQCCTSIQDTRGAAASTADRANDAQPGGACCSPACAATSGVLGSCAAAALLAGGCGPCLGAGGEEARRLEEQRRFRAEVERREAARLEEQIKDERRQEARAIEAEGRRKKWQKSLRSRTLG